MKLGLILNAINPGVGGLLIRGEKGTAKSTAVRALAQILPEIEVVSDCWLSCDPANPVSQYGAGLEIRAANAAITPYLIANDECVLWNFP